MGLKHLVTNLQAFISDTATYYNPIANNVTVGNHYIDKKDAAMLIREITRLNLLAKTLGSEEISPLEKFAIRLLTPDS